MASVTGEFLVNFHQLASVVVYFLPHSDRIFKLGVSVIIDLGVIRSGRDLRRFKLILGSAVVSTAVFGVSPKTLLLPAPPSTGKD
jgi:hypothetical protein